MWFSNTAYILHFVPIVEESMVKTVQRKHQPETATFSYKQLL